MTEQAGQGMVADRKVRLGFIGAGWWATVNHMPLLRARDDVEMVAVARRDPALLARVQEEFGFEHALTDYRALLELDLDGVVVSSPHAAHHEHAAAALRTGAHVLCEKPMTLDPAQAWELLTFMSSPDALKALLNGEARITARTDVNKQVLGGDPLLSLISQKVLPLTAYRPGESLYPQVSAALQQATADIVSGKSAAEAGAAYQKAVEKAVGAGKVSAS